MGQISLKAARVNAGYTLEDVGKLLDKSAKTVSNWERGATAVPGVEFNKLCEIYGMNSNFVKVPTVADGLYHEY